MDKVLSIIEYNNNILVGKVKPEKIQDFGGIKYVFPGGSVDSDESINDAVIRETKEEAGIDISIVEKIGERTHPITGKRIHYFWCKAESHKIDFSGKDNDDLESLSWVERKDLLMFMPTLFSKAIEFIFRNNPPSETWISPFLEVRNTSIAGKGMFAKRHIAQDEILVVWGGTYANKGVALEAEKNGKLIMQWDEDIYSIEDRGDDDGYFINHSCDPNLWMEGAYMLSAMRDIKQGEEVTADYAIWEADEKYVSKWECSCGHGNCRTRITGLDYKLKHLQEKYKDHFSPLLNKRIQSLSA